MATTCTEKIAIHDSVVELIATIRNAHDNGTGVPLISIIDLFGAPLDAAERAKVKARGDLTFTKESDVSGDFVNEGEAFTIKEGPAKIRIPVKLSGDYTSTDAMSNLSFDMDHTITLKALFFKSKLENVLMDQTLVKVDLEGNTFDRCFIHQL